MERADPQLGPDPASIVDSVPEQDHGAAMMGRAKAQITLHTLRSGRPLGAVSRIVNG
jgi:hypothetical protein